MPNWEAPMTDATRSASPTDLPDAIASFVQTVAVRTRKISAEGMAEVELIAVSMYGVLPEKFRDDDTGVESLRLRAKLYALTGNVVL